MKKKSILLSPSSDIAEKAAELSNSHNLPSINSLIYATAILNQSTLVTSDNDFRGLPKVEIVSP